jgi:hypothetical protein
MFSLFENKCIAVIPALFRGQITFQQFIPYKRNGFGVKLFVMCNYETAYVLDFIVYTENNTYSYMIEVFLMV